MTKKEDDQQTDEQKQQEKENNLVAFHIGSLRRDPIQGNFDIAHLKAIHAYIFQDLPHHQPGVTRRDTQNWVKHRALEDSTIRYDVGYASDNVKERINIILEKFGGPKSLEGLSVHDAAQRLAKLYGDLDHAHGFYEGNSRTLREFTRELASQSGLKLDWVGTNVTCEKRNDLYVARDIEVMSRAYPDLTQDRAMQTDNRHEYETFFRLEALRKLSNGKTLASIIEGSLKREKEKSRESPTTERSDNKQKHPAKQSLTFASDRSRERVKSGGKSGESQSLPFVKDRERDEGHER